MGASAVWRDSVSSLDVSQQELLTGGGLSKRFTKLPLWLSHPSNIGAFYGLLVSMALILPYYMTEEFWFPLWLLHASLLVAAVAALGIVSRIINALTKRMPISVNRKLLYPMPFIGFAFFTMIHTDLIVKNDFTQYLSWGLLDTWSCLFTFPGLQVLCMIEDGGNPFENNLIQQESDKVSSPR